MKKYIIIAAVLIGLVVALVVMAVQNRSLRQEYQDYQGNSWRYFKKYQDKARKQAAEVTEKRMQIDDLLNVIEHGDTRYNSLLQMYKDQGLKLKNLEGLGEVVTVIHDTIYIPFTSQDDKPYRFDDGYMSLVISPVNGKSRLEYSYTDTLQFSTSFCFLEKWKFKHIFHPRERYLRLNARNKNPKAAIVGAEFIKIKRR